MLRSLCVGVAVVIAMGFGAFGDDPVMGNWEGRFTTPDHESETISAQIIGLANDVYRAVLHIDRKGGAEAKAELGGIKKGAAAVFVGEIDLGEGAGVRTATAEVVNGKWEGRLRATGNDPSEIGFEMAKILRQSPTLGAKPPRGAVVLMDGTTLDAWNLLPGNLIDGAIQVGGSSFVSKREFGDCRIHLEFRTPYMPWAGGQGRGNSGVYVQGRYEIQVLDSFADTPASDLCGGIYNIATPLVNACLPPGEWQTYDITFFAPRFNEAGAKTENAIMTVLHNGVLIHDNVSLPNLTPAGVSDKEAKTGPLFLQDHGHAVQYRNIWVEPLDQREVAP